MRTVKKIFLLFFLLYCGQVLAQPVDLEYKLDINSNTQPLSKIFYPNIDLSGQGMSADKSYPPALAKKELIEQWNKNINNTQVYRLQFNLWDIEELSKDKEAQNKLIENYATLIKDLNTKGGIVILTLFGTPQGMGKVLDKKSVPKDFVLYKALVKKYIQEFSCNRKLKIWYEVWSAPDLEEFFLGTTQDYLLLYGSVAEAVKELELETKTDILVGGPSVSWWFRTVEGNTIVTPESSLIYELIRHCYKHKLALDFISWHAYSTDSKVEKENTKYNRKPVELIRPWLTYFNLNDSMPLIVDEWNYDNGVNLSIERQEKSYVNASYLPCRLKSMAEQGIDYQVFFGLEDFFDNKELVNRNIGVFNDKSLPKSVWNVFRMISMLGENMYVSSSKLVDDFVGVIATKQDQSVYVLIYNYIDPDAARNFLSKNIAFLNDKEREIIVDIIKTDKWKKLLSRNLDLNSLQLTGKLLNLFTKALEINDKSKEAMNINRTVQFELKNMKEDFLSQRFVVDSSCSANCNFVPVEEKTLEVKESYQWPLTLTPYSVQLLVFRPVIKKDAQANNLSVTLIKEVANIAEQQVAQKSNEINATAVDLKIKNATVEAVNGKLEIQKQIDIPEKEALKEVSVKKADIVKDSNVTQEQK